MLSHTARRKLVKLRRGYRKSRSSLQRHLAKLRNFDFATFRRTELNRKQLGHRFRQGIESFGAFLKTCYVDGAKALIAGKYTNKQAAVIILAMVPVLLTLAMMTVPSILFPTPEHKAFYNFACTLSADNSSLFPYGLGVISTTLGLKVPLG